MLAFTHLHETLNLPLGRGQSLGLFHTFPLGQSHVGCTTPVNGHAKGFLVGFGECVGWNVGVGCGVPVGAGDAEGAPFPGPYTNLIASTS